MARKKDDEKRKNILESATKVFASKGFYNAKIQDVATEAGVAHGTVYLYFKNKDDLLSAIFCEVLGELIEYIRSEVQKEKTAEDKFRRMISLQIDIIEENPDLTKLILIEFPRTGKFLSNSNIDILSKYIDMIADIIDKGIKEGEFNTDIKIDMLATMIYAGIQGLATRWILDEMQYTLKGMEKGVSDLFIEGIKRHSDL